MFHFYRNSNTASQKAKNVKSKSKSKREMPRRTRKFKFLIKFRPKCCAVIKKSWKSFSKKTSIRVFLEILSWSLSFTFFNICNLSVWKMNIFSSKSTMLHIMFINLESNANSIKDFIKKKTKILFSNSTQFFWIIQHLKLIPTFSL